MTSLAPQAKFRAFDTNGNPLSGGKLYTYAAGTTTPLATTKDAAGTPNTNPIILDQYGQCDIWLSTASFKLLLKDSGDVTQPGWPVDNVQTLEGLIVSSTTGAIKTIATFAALSSTSGQIGQQICLPDGGIFNCVSSSGLTADSANIAINGSIAWVRAIYLVKSDFIQRPAASSLPRLFKTLQSYRHDTQPAINIVGFGSSVGVGATLPYPTTQAPVAHFFTKLKSAIDPSSLYNFVKYNDSVNGSTISESIAKLADAVTAGHTPKLCVLAYGMNDAQVAIYNAGQTFPGVYTAAMQFVRNARALGADVILMTTPHHKTASGSTLYVMPAGIAQSYPTAIPANVLPEQLQPPASTSNVTADFLQNGTTVTASHRHLRVNEAMRQAATDSGVPLIDVERYWFQAVHTYGEAALFDVGETVHPNLIGHQNSYWLAIDDFLQSIGLQSAQEGQEPRLNGLVGINSDLPTAVLDVYPPDSDSTSPPIRVSARIGHPNGASVKDNCPVLAIDPSNGDLVLYGAKSTDSSSIEFYRRHFILDGTGTTISKTTEINTLLSGMVNTVTHYGEYNKALGTTTIFAVPDNSMGGFEINAYNTGIGRQRVRIEWVATSGTLTLSGVATVGAAVLTGPTASGLNIQVNFAANNTNYMARLEAVTGV